MTWATRLADQVSAQRTLQLQNIALKTPWAGIASVAEAAELMKIPHTARTSSSAAITTGDQAVRCLGSSGATSAASLLAFARVAAATEHLLVVEFGPATVLLQYQALARRLNVDVSTLRSTKPALNGTHLAVCMSCKRVATSFVGSKSASTSPFDETGNQCCQRGVTGSFDLDVTMHCAKRQSSSSRGAQEAELSMKQQRVEMEPLATEDIYSLFSGAKICDKKEAGETALQLRRDCRVAFEQAPSLGTCNDSRMASILILGRAIRIFGSWYTLCTRCAAPMQLVFGSTWYGSDICCMRCGKTRDCDRDSDGGDADADADPDPDADPCNGNSPFTQCRFCGVARSTGGLGWRTLHAPLDVAGPNADIPVSLRSVHYCRSHYRPWLIAAHLTLETRIIISHITHDAKPIFSEEREKKDRNSSANKKKNLKFRKRKAPG
jgi:hypothetical protein